MLTEMLLGFIVAGAAPSDATVAWPPKPAKERSATPQALKPFASPLFAPPGSQSLRWMPSWGGPLEAARATEAPAGSAPPIDCRIRVLKADPQLDTRIATEAPKDIDPRIVRRSQCREP